MRKPMGKVRDSKRLSHLRRKLVIRKRVVGTAQRPRICTVRSNKNLVVQAVDDTQSKTVVSVQTFGRKAVVTKVNREKAKIIGQTVAKKLSEQGITKGVFDRNGNIYGGIMASVAEGLREEGMRI